MSDEFFGEAPEAERRPRLKIVWPSRALNTIEGDLMGALSEELALVEHRAPIIWIENDTFANADDYGGISAIDAMAVQDIVRAEAIQKFRRQLIIARECGETQRSLTTCPHVRPKM